LAFANAGESSITTAIFKYLLIIFAPRHRWKISIALRRYID